MITPEYRKSSEQFCVMSCNFGQHVAILQSPIRGAFSKIVYSYATCSDGNSGIGPYQSQTQYLRTNVGEMGSGNKAETPLQLRGSSVSTLSPLQATSRQQYGNEEETEWKRCCRSVVIINISIFMKDSIYHDWKTTSSVFSFTATIRKRSGNVIPSPTRCHYQNPYFHERTSVMNGNPYQSILVPYEDEINILRRRRPPYSYARIAEILKEKYQISVCRETIFRFVKVRSKNRKVYAIYGAPLPKKQESVKAIPLPANQPESAPTSPVQKPKPYFDFPFSETYNLHRLPPEEAAARLKKLEEREKAHGRH